MNLKMIINSVLKVLKKIWEVLKKVLKIVWKELKKVWKELIKVLKRLGRVLKKIPAYLKTHLKFLDKIKDFLKTKKPTRLKTKNLIIVPLTDDEMQREVEKATDSHISAAYTQMLKNCQENPEDREWCALWSIRLKDKDKQVGLVSFLGKPKDYQVEVGFGIDEDYRDNGYAYEMIQAMCDYAFIDENVYYVVARTNSDNQPCRKVLEKAKFTCDDKDAEILTYEIERPKTAWTAIFMCLGLSVGMCFGQLFENVGVGMGIGIALGAGVGASLDANDNKKRKEIRNKRIKSNQ